MFRGFHDPGFQFHGPLLVTCARRSTVSIMGGNARSWFANACPRLIILWGFVNPCTVYTSCCSRNLIGAISSATPFLPTTSDAPLLFLFCIWETMVLQSSLQHTLTALWSVYCLPNFGDSVPQPSAPHCEMSSTALCLLWARSEAQSCARHEEGCTQQFGVWNLVFSFEYQTHLLLQL